MFTGIVEEVGQVVALEPVAGATRLTVEAHRVAASALGDSIAVDGVCLTAADVEATRFAADVMPETLRRSTLSGLTVGRRVNLERAVTAASRMGGHIVQGHVDDVGHIVGRNPGPRWDEVRVSVPLDLARFIAEKGSIAVDGVSLTVMAVSADEFAVGLIPTTLAGTTLGERQVGDTVNIEVDVIAKYVDRLLTARASTTPGRVAATIGTEHPA